MRKIKSKKNLFILILLIVISSTVAYLYSTDTFQNIFVAASYKVVVTETFESPDNWKPGDTTPKTATLKNEGTVPIKVRVKIEEEWKDSNNQDLPLQHNDENVAIINFSNEDDYIYKDGYYYYDLPLNPGETTSSIIESVTFNPNYSGTITCVENDNNTHTCSSSESGYEGGTYKLTLTIEGVQEDYYVQAWGLSGMVERQYLYDVLKNEAESNGLAREYSGNHHDSFTEAPSQKIYHWYAENDTEGTSILDKNNVVFGEHCWQMIRTTDTGGVKMIYNGEAIDNQCLQTRGTHVGYASRSSQTLDSSYWYGTDYIYDPTNKVFTLSGITEQTICNEMIGPTLVGKYTCLSGNLNDSCSTLYLVESYKSSNSAYLRALNSNSNYSQFGKLSFNTGYKSPTYVGYKYGDVYTSNPIASTSREDFKTSDHILESGIVYLSTAYWYSDSISYDSITGKYSLVNPYKVSSSADYPNLVGKYTFGKSVDTYTDTFVYYIAGVDDITIYYKRLRNGDLLSVYDPIMIGDSVVENGDGTYTINNPINVSLIDWYTDYSNYNNKYTCNDSNITCASPRYLVSTYSSVYYYVKVNEKILVGKARNGLNLIDTILVSKDKWYNNYNNYTDYVYTCNTDSALCTEETLRMIVEYKSTEYSYVSNCYFGSSVTWDGTNYTLIDPIEIETYNNLTNLSGHHYICPNLVDKVCSKVYYVFLKRSDNMSDNMYYIILKDGIDSVSKAMDDMFTKNTNDTIIKKGIDAWYKHTMLRYDDYIEDTIFCNDRSIRSFGGWDPNGGRINQALYFKTFETTTDNLSCTNVTDKFSVSNNSAKLDFKVGLMSLPEMNLLNNSKVLKTGQHYWLGTPDLFGEEEATGYYIYSNGHSNSSPVNYTMGLRPAISLKPGIEYSSGDGSTTNPYVIETN